MTISKEIIDKTLDLIEELEEDREFFAIRYEDMVEEAKLKNRKIAELEKENRMLKVRAGKSDSMLRLTLAKLDELSKNIESYTTFKTGNKFMSKLERLTGKRENIDESIPTRDLTPSNENKISSSSMDKLKEDLKTTYGDLDELV